MTSFNSSKDYDIVRLADILFAELKSVTFS